MTETNPERIPQHETLEATLMSSNGPSALLWAPFLNGFQAWNGALAAVNREWLAFVNRRLQHDVTLPPLLASCHTPEEMWRVMAEFYRQAFGDYQREFNELARLSSTAANESMRAWQQGDEADFDMPERTPRH